MYGFALRTPDSQNGPQLPVKFFRWRKWLASIAGIAVMVGLGSLLMYLAVGRVYAQEQERQAALVQYLLHGEGAAPIASATDPSGSFTALAIVAVLILSAALVVPIIKAIRRHRADKQWVALAEAARQNKSQLVSA